MIPHIERPNINEWSHVAMKRTTVYLDERSLMILNKAKEVFGIDQSEFIRRAIELKGKEDNILKGEVDGQS
jgi:hypothetical protein